MVAMMSGDARDQSGAGKLIKRQTLEQIKSPFRGLHFEEDGNARKLLDRKHKVGHAFYSVKARHRSMFRPLSFESRIGSI